MNEDNWINLNHRFLISDNLNLSFPLISLTPPASITITKLHPLITSLFPSTMNPISTFLQNLNNPINFFFSSDSINNDHENQPHFLFTFFAVSTAFLFTYWSYLKFRQLRSPLPPGPPGIPLLGNLPFLDPELHTYFRKLSHKYGPIVKLHLGNKIAIVINSPSMAVQVLKDHDIAFANRDVPSAAKVLTYGGHDIAWTPYGPEWRMLRKVCVIKMLSHQTLESFYSLRRREVRKTVSYIYSRAVAGSSIDVGEQAFFTVLNVVTSMLWGGTTVDAEERERIGAEFRETVSEMTHLLIKPNISDFYPWLACFDLQGIEKQTKKIMQRFDKIFDAMIDQRQAIGNDSDEVEKKDFLQFLLRLKDEQDSKTPLTMIHIKALLMDMVLGGTETSGNAVEFAMAEMIKNPEMMRKAQQELDSVVGEDGIVEESDIQNLPYLKAVMKETLRLYPMLPLLIPHCPSQNTIIGNYTIPKGSRVFVNVWSIQRDPNYWENPLEFNAERFLNNSKWDYSGNDLCYFPFGSGRRNCAGIAMAERNFLYSLATLLHSFDWKLKEGEESDVSEKFGIVLKKKIPLLAVPTPRLADPNLYH